MSIYSVYIHTNKVNGKRYIGVTEKDPKERWANGNGYRNNPYFNAAIKKYGWDNFEHFILEVGSEELMYQLEQQYIAYYKTTDRRYGYNISPGGDKGHNLGKNSGSKEYRKYYVDKWYKEHREEQKIKFKQYKESHKEQVKEGKSRWYKGHCEEVKLKSKQYRESHKEQIKEYKKRYYEHQKMNKDTPITPLW